LWLSQNISEIRRNLSDAPTIEIQDITKFAFPESLKNIDKIILLRLNMVNSKAMKHESVIANADMMRYEFFNLVVFTVMLILSVSESFHQYFNKILCLTTLMDGTTFAMLSLEWGKDQNF